MLYRYLGLSLLLLSSIILSSCNSSQASQSDFQLLLTDAPADEASELMVHFGEIQLIASDTEDASPVTISEEGGSFDVLKLRNGTTALLSDTSIANGSYGQLRLVIKEANITIDGKESAISIPSGAQSGLKINIEPPLLAQDGQKSVIILDFNANRVIETGNGKYILSPTAIRASSISGTLQGVLEDAEGNPLEGGLIAVKDASGELVTETKTATDGLFKMISLTEGSYTVEISLEGFVSQSFTDVSILANEVTELTESGTVVLELAPSP